MPFKRLTLLCLGLSVPLLPASATAQAAHSAPAAASWKAFTPAEGGFSIEFPGVPERKEGEISVDKGGPGKTYFYTVAPAGALYLAGWGEYAPSFKFDYQAELDANRDSFVNGIGATLVSNKAISLGGAPGIEFDFSKQSVLFGRGRVYIVDGKPYQLVFMHRGTALDLATASRFLDSFRPTAR